MFCFSPKPKTIPIDYGMKTKWVRTLPPSAHEPSRVQPPRPPPLETPFSKQYGTIAMFWGSCLKQHRTITMFSGCEIPLFQTVRDNHVFEDAKSPLFKTVRDNHVFEDAKSPLFKTVRDNRDEPAFLQYGTSAMFLGCEHPPQNNSGQSRFFRGAKFHPF